MTKNKFVIALFSGLNIISVTLLALIALGAGLAPAIHKFGLFQPVLILFFSSVVLTIVTIALGASEKPPVRLKKMYIPLVVVLFIVIAAIQVVYAWGLLSDGYTWDTKYVFEAAVQIVTNGSLDATNGNYLTEASNNLGITYLLAGLFTTMKFFGFTNYLWGATLFNVTVLLVVQILIFLSAHRMYGRRIALLSLPFSFVLVGLTMHVQTPYTDTIAILFPILIFYLVTVFVTLKSIWTRSLLAGFIGLVAGTGYLIKPTVIIALIAVLFVGLLVWLFQGKKIVTFKKLRDLFLPVITGGLTIAAVYFGFGAYVNHSQLLPVTYQQALDKALPLQHFINIGSKTGTDGPTTNYGGYNQQTVDIVSALPTREAKVDYSIESYGDQLREYGLIGYISFLIHKASWITSDATFYAYGEGDLNSVSFKNNDNVSVAVRNAGYVYNPGYYILGNVMQVFWLAILLMIALQFIITVASKKFRINPFVTIIHLMLIGIIAFLLIFEGRSRYLFLYVPMFILAGLYTVYWIQNKTQISNE
ncbi:MAG: hypothetical protein WAR37_04035 [Candidatus Microsaccharimonas sp.]